MKSISLISILLFLYNTAISCSCMGLGSFCHSHSYYAISASCVIVDTIPHGISMKVLHLFHGNENRDTINVFDLGGPYGLCNDSLTNTRAAYLGDIGDTMIISLHKIDSLKNNWDVIGDYRKEGFTCAEFKLRVENDTVKGLVSGNLPDCNYSNDCLKKYPYDAFIEDFPQKRLSCENWVSTNNPIKDRAFSFFPNPATKNVFVETSENGEIAIFNNLGQTLDLIELSSGQTRISVAQLPAGIYFLEFQSQNHNDRIIKKLILRH